MGRLYVKNHFQISNLLHEAHFIKLGKMLLSQNYSDLKISLEELEGIKATPYFELMLQRM